MKIHLSTESIGMLRTIAELELVDDDANIVIEILVSRYFEHACCQFSPAVVNLTKDMVVNMEL